MTQETDLQRAQDILSVTKLQRDQALNAVAEIQANLAAALRKLEEYDDKRAEEPQQKSSEK